MTEPIDVYADQFQINLGPWGATLNFQVSSPHPPAPGSQVQIDTVATVRTSLEHLKAMTIILRRQLLQFERDYGVVVNVPVRILAAMGIAKEDWDGFWRQEDR